jgi:hypothetical protein
MPPARATAETGGKTLGLVWWTLRGVPSRTGRGSGDRSIVTDVFRRALQVCPAGVLGKHPEARGASRVGVWRCNNSRGFPQHSSRLAPRASAWMEAVAASRRSLAAIARDAGIDPDALSGFLEGTQGLPSESLDRLAHAAGVVVTMMQPE